MGRDKTSLFIGDCIDECVSELEGNSIIRQSPQGLDFEFKFVKDNRSHVVVCIRRWGRSFDINEAKYIYGVLDTFTRGHKHFNTFSLWKRDGQRLYMSLHRKVYLEIVDNFEVVKSYSGEEEKGK